jgi:hypothetical protein
MGDVFGFVDPSRFKLHAQRCTQRARHYCSMLRPREPRAPKWMGTTCSLRCRRSASSSPNLIRATGRSSPSRYRESHPDTLQRFDTSARRVVAKKGLELRVTLECHQLAAVGHLVVAAAIRTVMSDTSARHQD